MQSSKFNLIQYQSRNFCDKHVAYQSQSDTSNVDRYSVQNPDYDFNFWHIPYYLNKRKSFQCKFMNSKLISSWIKIAKPFTINLKKALLSENIISCRVCNAS